MADWMLFGVVSEVGQWVSVLDGVEIVKGEEAGLVVNVGHSVVTSGDFVA